MIDTRPSDLFIDQVVYRGDTEMYDWCLDYYGRWYYRISRCCNVFTKDELQLINRFKNRLDAIKTGNRDACIAELEEQKRKFIKKLDTKLGIKV